MMTEMKTNNGKRLVAAVAIFAMLACALAFVVPASDGEAFASSAENPINLDGAAISSQDDFPEGETAITAGLSATNAGLGNTEMKAEVNGTTVTISGKLNMQDITPYGNDIHHINSIMQPCTCTSAPVIGVAITAETMVPGCGTGCSHYTDVEEAARFMLEAAKAYGRGEFAFYDEAEYARIQKLYGSMKHLQTLGKE